MSRRRLRLPGPALVVAMLALAVALGGTAFAAGNAATAQTKHTDRKADVKLIKKLAPTLSVKHATSATSAETAMHAGTADSATKAANATNATTAANATNATNAANASKLGGVAASSYLTNGGTIFVSTGTSNWHPSNTIAPVNFVYADYETEVTPTTAGSVALVAHPSLPTALYGRKLELTSATLCYSASTNAKITQVVVSHNTYSNSGVGQPNDVVSDTKTRTGHACSVFTLSTPAVLSSLDDVSIDLEVDFKTGGILELGQSGVTLAPTATAASSTKSGAGGSS